MAVYPVPTWDRAEQCLKDGSFFRCPTYCGKQNIDKCRQHYNDITGKKGFHKCHAGLSSYSTGNSNQPIFSGIRISGHYDNPKIKKANDYLPTLPKQLVIDFVEEVTSDTGIRQRDIELVNSSLHEIRKFNLEIKRISEEILNDQKIDSHDIKNKAKTIFAASSLISVRLNIHDFEENPGVITASTPYNARIYSKFDKAAHVLGIYGKDQRVKIQPFKGNSFKSIQVYPVFDFLPFVILENAIKYSPSDQDVSVEFIEYGATLEVVVKSIGPTIRKSELENIFEKGSRGEHASTIDDSGGGYGMYFAKLICDLHELQIDATSGTTVFNLGGIDYSEFEVRITAT